MLFREHVYFLCVLLQLGNKQSPSIWKTLLRRGTGNGEQGTSTEKDKWKIRSKVNKANLNSSAISKFLYYALLCSHLSFPVSRVTFPSKITTSKQIYFYGLEKTIFETENRTEWVHATSRFLFLFLQLYGICVKILIMNRYISKSYTKTNYTIDGQYTERGQL